jgi:hypothetical protein
MIQVEIDDREVRQALEELRRRTSDMAPAMHAIGQALMEGSRERIQLFWLVLGVLKWTS